MRANKLPSPNHCESRDFLLVFKNLSRAQEAGSCVSTLARRTVWQGQLPWPWAQRRVQPTHSSFQGSKHRNLLTGAAAAVKFYCVSSTQP